MEQRPRPGSESRLRAGQPRGHGPRRAEPARPLPLGLSLSLRQPAPPGSAQQLVTTPGLRVAIGGMPPPQPIPAGRRLPRQELAPPPAAISGPGAASGRAAGGPGMALALRLLLPLLGAAALPGARSRLHSRRVLSTVVSEPGPGLPWYSSVGYVDDQVIYVYASGMQRVEPRTTWMAQNEGPELWDLRLFWSRRWEAWVSASLNTLRELYSQTQGDNFRDFLCR